MVTIKKIAEICGISRGTVDRVLNERGRYSEETAKKVWQVARELGYQPNPAGKALSARRHRPVVGVLVALTKNPFFDEVMRGIRVAAKEYRIYGLETTEQSLEAYDVDEQLERIETMVSAHDISALILNPVNDTRIAKKIDELAAQGIFVVTVNNDITGSKRHAFTGSDYINSGKTACALLALLTRGSAEIAIVVGSHKLLGHEERVQGFIERMQSVKGFHLCSVVESGDDEITAYRVMQRLLSDEPRLNAVFFAAAGTYGACRAIEESKRQVTAIAVDTVPTNVEMLEKGVLTALIYQHPYRQGHKAMELVFQYVVNGIAPLSETVIMKNDIKLLENL